MNQWLSGVFQEFSLEKLEETVYYVIFLLNVPFTLENMVQEQ